MDRSNLHMLYISRAGLTWYHAKLGIMMALQKLVDAGIVSTDFQVQNVTDL